MSREGACVCCWDVESQTTAANMHVASGCTMAGMQYQLRRHLITACGFMPTGQVLPSCAQLRSLLAGSSGSAGRSPSAHGTAAAAVVDWCLCRKRRRRAKQLKVCKRCSHLITPYSQYDLRIITERSWRGRHSQVDTQIRNLSNNTFEAS